MLSRNLIELVMDKTLKIDETELAKLVNISQIQNYICKNYGELVISSANESHINELGELWANHAAIQQLSAPDRYDFKFVKQDWREFVRNKLNKKHHLLLVVQNKGEYEVKGFLYLQIITIPSSELVLKGVIEDIYTKPQYRKQGIATKLLDTAVDWSIKNCIKQIDLISLENAKDVSEFYNKFLTSRSKDISLGIITL